MATKKGFVRLKLDMSVVERVNVNYNDPSSSFSYFLGNQMWDGKFDYFGVSNCLGTTTEYFKFLLNWLSIFLHFYLRVFR